MDVSKLFIIPFVLLLGFARLLLEVTEWPTLGLDQALQAARCLVPKTEIKAPATFTLLGLPSEPPIGSSAAKALEFRALGPLQVAMPTAELDKILQDAPAGKDLLLPAKSTLILTKSKGSFEFRLQGEAEFRQSKGRFLLQANDTVRFGPTDDASYFVSFPNDIQLEVKEDNGRKQAMLRAGTTGVLSIGNGQALILLQAITAAPWPFQIAPSIVPERVVGQTGLASLGIEARQPGVAFNASGFSISACATSDGNWRPVGVKIGEAGDSSATLLLSLPEALLPKLTGWKRFWTNVELLVASSDGQYIAYGGFTAIGRTWAAIITLLLTGSLFWWLANLRHEQRRASLAADKDVWKKEWRQWFFGLFVGGDNDPSLSLFQVFLWTVITVWGLMYVFTITGNLLSLTQEMLWLLGIAGAGSIAARWIAASTPGGSTSRAAGAAPEVVTPIPGATIPPPPVEFWQILSTNGRFDLLKLQIFVFTLMVAVYVIWRIADTGVFPVLDSNTLLLLGVSQGVYIGGKMAGRPAS
jgi:hypothetical protein